MARRRLLSVLIAGGWLISAATARAQDVPDEGTPPAETPAPEGTPETAPEPPSDTPAEAPPSPELVEAQERISRGEQLFETGNYDGALVEFLRAEELLRDHPAHYLVLFNVGKTYEQLFRYDQAMNFYRQYLEEGGRDAEDAPMVQAKIELLNSQLGTVRVTVNAPSYSVWVDGRNLGEDLESFMVPGGSHTVEVRARGFQSDVQEVQLPARSERTLTFELEELAEEFEGMHPAWFWTSTSLAVASAVVGGVFGIMAIKRRNDLDPFLGDGLSDEEQVEALRTVTQDDKDEIGRLSLTADILYGAALLFATGAVVFAFLTDWDSAPAGEASAEARLRLMPTASRDAAGLLLQGAF